MFISFEGIDGSGKTTQARHAAAYVQSRGRQVVSVREPGGTSLGEHIRHLLLDPEGDVSARAELLLFCAARAHLVERVIRPALHGGSVVIADRFVDSTTAYQGYGRSVLQTGDATFLHDLVTARLRPHLTVLVDVDVATAFSRRAGDAADRMEAEDRAFHERVRKGYLTLAKAEPERIVTVDGRASEQMLADQIEHLLDQWLFRRSEGLGK